VPLLIKILEIKHDKKIKNKNPKYMISSDDIVDKLSDMLK